MLSRHADLGVKMCLMLLQLKHYRRKLDRFRPCSYDDHYFHLFRLFVNQPSPPEDPDLLRARDRMFDVVRESTARQLRTVLRLIYTPYSCHSRPREVRFRTLAHDPIKYLGCGTGLRIPRQAFLSVGHTLTP